MLFTPDPHLEDLKAGTTSTFAINPALGADWFNVLTGWVGHRPRYGDYPGTQGRNGLQKFHPQSSPAVDPTQGVLANILQR